MSQITGQKRETANPKLRRMAILASTDPTDHRPNGALAVSLYAGATGMLVDDDGSGIIYVGEVAPGFTADTDQPIWRIKKIDKTANPCTIQFAVVPASGDVPEKYAQFAHVWDDRADIGTVYK